MSLEYKGLYTHRCMEFTALEASGIVIQPPQQVVSPTPNGQLRKLNKYRHAEMSVNYRPRGINALKRVSQPVVSRTPNDRLRKLHELNMQKCMEITDREQPTHF